MVRLSLRVYRIFIRQSQQSLSQGTNDFASVDFTFDIYKPTVCVSLLPK